MGRRVVPMVALLFLVAGCGGGGDGGAQLREGERAPDFTLPSAEGGRVALGDFAGRKPVLLYFSMGPG